MRHPSPPVSVARTASPTSHMEISQLLIQRGKFPTTRRRILYRIATGYPLGLSFLATKKDNGGGGIEWTTDV